MLILYTKFNEYFSEEKLLSMVSELPLQFVESVNGFRNLKDRYARLFGKFLLKEGLNMIDLNLKLKDIKYSTYGRPYFANDVDFNISHSDEVVVCAISTHYRVGIDIEKNTEVNDFNSYQEMFTRHDWDVLNLGTNKTFYEYWTKKEAIMKADGRGISNAFANLEITSKDVFILENQKWYLTELNFYNEYTCHLACNSRDIKVQTLEILF